ncbi:Endoribonuclease YbeY, partial [Dissostichus eleginoides]
RVIKVRETQLGISITWAEQQKEPNVSGKFQIKHSVTPKTDSGYLQQEPVALGTCYRAKT